MNKKRWNGARLCNTRISKTTKKNAQTQTDRERVRVRWKQQRKRWKARAKAAKNVSFFIFVYIFFLMKKYFQMISSCFFSRSFIVFTFSLHIHILYLCIFGRRFICIFCCWCCWFWKMRDAVTRRRDFGCLFIVCECVRCARFIGFFFCFFRFLRLHCRRRRCHHCLIINTRIYTTHTSKRSGFCACNCDENEDISMKKIASIERMAWYKQ